MFAPLERHSARDQAGFGMVELVCAMGVMAIGVLAVYAMFESGMIQMKRASTVSTAAAIADSEIENYRAVRYETIGLASADVDASDSTYRGDTAYRAISSPANQANSTVIVAACPATPCTTSVPTKTLTGADAKSYRLDTYVTWQTVTGSDPDGAGPNPAPSGRNVKLVTVVVRDAATSHVYARAASSFDSATGE